MKVSVQGKRGRLDGANWVTRAPLAKSLNTVTEIVGDSILFEPTRHTLDHLVSVGADFHPACRTAWAHFYKAKTIEDYDFEFTTKPYDHQFKIWEKVKDLEYFALEWEMGLGKTKTLLDIAAWKRQQGEIDTLLVVTLSGVHRNWIDKEVPTHWPKDKTKAAYWNTNRVEAGMRGLVENDGFSIITINMEAVARKKGEAFCMKVLKSRKVMLAFDESHKLKTPSANTTKALHRMADHAVCRFTATGTPVPVNGLDLWGPYRFLSTGLIWEQYWAFRKKYAIQQEMVLNRDQPNERTVTLDVGTQNMDELKSRIDPHRSRLLKKDVLNLPEKLYRQRVFEMSGKQRQAYNKLLEELLIELGEFDMVTAPMALTMITKLRQIACGFVKSDEGVDYELMPTKSNPRIIAAMGELENVQGKAIIWSPFKFCTDQLLETIRESFGEASVLRMDGAVPMNARMPIQDKFQDMDSKVRFLLSSEAAGGTGYTLTAATDTLYYGNTHSLVLRLQSEDRNHRIGQDDVCTYTDMIARGTVDEDIRVSLIDKRDAGAQLTGDDLREWLTTVKA